MNTEDLNHILDHALSMGCDLLEKGGYFHPFSFALSHDGELMRSGELTDEEKGKDTDEILKQIHNTLASGCRQKMHKAVVVVSDVKVKRFASEGYVRAIEAMIEHEDGSGHDCFLPYNKNTDGVVQYGTLFSSSFDSEKFIAK
jgi:hypothetical protein